MTTMTMTMTIALKMAKNDRRKKYEISTFLDVTQIRFVHERVSAPSY